MAARRIDAVVVGLGPAGASASAALATAGCEVLAIDRKAAPGEPVQCAEFVPAVIGAEVRDLAPVCLQPISSMLTFVEGEAPDEMANFPGMMIDRRAFDARLVERAAAAGADCRFGVKLRGLTPDGALSVGEQRIAPRVIIGADGPRSVVGAAIGRANRDLVETRQIRVPLTDPHLATDIFLRADMPGGYGWLFPRDEFANLGLGVRPEDRAALKPRLETLHASLVAEGRVGPEVFGHTGGAIPVGGMLDPVGALGSAQVLLAGDAAGLANPVTGAGINSAAVSGRLAGEFAAEWLTGQGDALTDYRDEIAFLLGGALGRALARRADLLRTYETGGPTARDLRDSWIAYPQYWAA